MIPQQTPGIAPSCKYFGEQATPHNGQLQWPGMWGLPYRGPATPLSKDDYSRLYVAGDACHGTFNLGDEQQSLLYCWVRDRIRNNLFTLDHIERFWDQTTKTMHVYMEWTQCYVQLAPNPWSRIR